MRYYLIAGEASGDLHASNLMAEILRIDSQALFRFYGGDMMQAVGGTLVKHYKEMSFMGFIPVLTHARTILRNMKACKRDVAEWNVAKGFECNYDAVQKPIAQGLLIGDPKKWVDNGAQKQAPALAEAMLNLLDNKCIPSLNE